MGQHIELHAGDGFKPTAYLATPPGKARGGIVIAQEIFGLTKHIRSVVDQYAAAGYLSIAPALFDRVERNADVPYSDVKAGYAIMQKLDTHAVMLDLAAAIDHVKSSGKVGIVGYCWGGTMAYLAASRLEVDAAVAYYAGGADRYAAETPRSPILFHYGARDEHISRQARETVQAAVPHGIFHLYDADHGFNCSDRGSYDAAAAKLAFERSIEFLHEHVG